MTQYPSESDNENDSVIEAELVSESPPDSPGASENRLSISGVISWIVVVVITFAVVMFVATAQQIDSETVDGDATSGDLMQVQLAGKMLVGQQHLQAIADGLAGDQNEELADDAQETLAEQERKTIETAIESANTGTFEQQLVCVVLTNELLGADLALEKLDDLNERVAKHKFSRSENQLILSEAVSNVVHACAEDSFDDATLSIEEEKLMDEKLGWLGRLASAPELSGKTELREAVIAEATRSLVICSLASIAGILAMITGFVLAMRTIRFWRRGEFESRFQIRVGIHNIYIETFALWLIYFFGIQFAIGPWVEAYDLDPLAINPFIFFSSLIVLVWPVIRGIPFSQVRQDIGWTSTKPLRDFLSAPVGYLATIPLVFITLMLMGGLIIQSVEPGDTEEFSRGQSISHPIQEYVADSDATVFLWIVLSACVAAPIVEETVFRGILYRHLRDLTSHWRTTVTVAFSAVINAFIFAAIHPQGVMLIPVLGSLAVGFSLMREWRGSLYPSMIMHAIHNGLVTCLMFAIL